MHTKKSDTSKSNLEAKIIFLFSQKIKRKQANEEEEPDIYITRITTTFECYQIKFLIFLDLIKQLIAIVKTKIESFIKNIN